MKIALTGGIACGKSAFAKFLAELGIRVLDADDVVHELEAPGGAAVPAIVAAFGPSVLAPDGGINRAQLANLVFPTGPVPTVPTGSGPVPMTSGSVPTGSVPTGSVPTGSVPTGSVPTGSVPTGSVPTGSVPTGSVPTRVRLEGILFPLVRARLREFVKPQDGVFRIAVIPLLFESHFESDYDTIISLVSPHDVQVGRMMCSRGSTRAQAEARIAAQMPVAEKAARSDYVVINDSTLEHLKDEARRLFAWLNERAQV